jgi:hypothetical protein
VRVAPAFTVRRGARAWAALLAGAASLWTTVAAANEIQVKREENRFIYFLDTPFTPRAWAEADFNLRVQMFDIPGTSAPNPEVGFAVSAPGASFKFFDRLELKIDALMLANPNDLGGPIPVDDAGAANDGKRDFGGADFDLSGVRAGLKLTLVKGEKMPVRFAVGADYTLGILNTPKHKHYDGGPFLTPYDHALHGYLTAAFSFAKYMGLKMHVGLSMAIDAQRDAIFPGQDLPKLDLWVDYSLTLNWLFEFTGTAIFAGVEGRSLVAGVTTNLVEDQLSAFGGFVFNVGSATDISIALQVPVASAEYRDFLDFALVGNWSMDFDELSFFPEKKAEKTENAVPKVVRNGRLPDCPSAGPSKLTVINETAYKLVLDWEEAPEAAPAGTAGAAPAAAAAPAATATAAAPAAAAPAAAATATAAAAASAPASMPVLKGTVTLAPGATEHVDFSKVPIRLTLKVKADGATDVPDGEGAAKLDYCGDYVLKFEKDSIKTKDALVKAAKEKK